MMAWSMDAVGVVTTSPDCVSGKSQFGAVGQSAGFWRALLRKSKAAGPGSVHEFCW